MDPCFLAYAERQAPRYTSYPTPPHFTPAVGASTYAEWLAALSPDAPLSLYVHVPYCREICWYCGCNTFAARRDEPVGDYVEALIREIELVGGTIAARGVGELHWGGGTPNILSPAQFTRAHQHLAFLFDMNGRRGHAVEIDPRCLTREHAVAYAAAGVNRVSIGAQDFNAHVQKAIGRMQPPDLVAAAIGLLRDVGIGEISLDLMYGLPQQSVADLLRSIRIAAGMRPQRLALFGYAHVPWFKTRQRLIDETSLPDASQRFDQAEAARIELALHGYIPVGLDHFALPDDELAVASRTGALHRSFQGYCPGAPLPIVGFGPSAISTLPQGYAQNLAEVGAWSSAIDKARFATARGHALCDDDRRRGALIEQIMCAFTGDLRPLGGAGQCAREMAALAPLIRDGIVTVAGDDISIPVHGRPFCRLVAQAFDAYAADATARHSRAV